MKAPFSWPNNSLSSNDLGQRRAVDGDEGFVVPVGVSVDGSRGEFLAGAGLAVEQDGGVGEGDLAAELFDA